MEHLEHVAATDTCTRYEHSRMLASNMRKQLQVTAAL
jgi:hypothetical protein